MTHFRIDIQLPLAYNPEQGKPHVMIEPGLFRVTYNELLEIADGINVSSDILYGSWIHPTTRHRYDDETRVFTVVVESEDKRTAKNATKVRQLIDYKEKLKERFKQHEIFMVATRCCWL